MNNANMPAMPMGKGADGRLFTASDLGDGYAAQCRPAFGLTKREYFAGLAMQGILSADINDMVSEEVAAKCAVSLSDALMAELEKELKK